MRHPALISAALLGACGWLDPQPASAPEVAAERVDAFAILLEQTGCRFDADDHDPVHAAGFTDAEIGDLGTALVADGRAELAPSGDLVLVSGACL